LEKAKPARKTTAKKSNKKSEILELDFDPIEMLDEVDSKEGKELKAVATKLNITFGAVTRNTAGMMLT